MLTDYSSFRFHLEFDEDDHMADFMRKINDKAFVVNKSQETWYPEKGREDHFTTYTTNYGKINGLWVIDKNTCLNLFIHGSSKLSSATFSRLC
ncbi:hypothetical protein SGGMMB4_05083 [Sodalis glossinidius str. 'morsitans']|uniref:Uncharacterized protein n=1 Tax=Sodalis glossinidius (strain morsitans) TaxID=343509 RepID=A0A193QMQ8_SODGM|nr:hypothetical protein [Sodalis glossinidius]CRL46442.1 hypothetical protein SGGMMB4_05083 [Sodalis glossinidius str. 'morsitans']